jgi:hypothetical protein
MITDRFVNSFKPFSRKNFIPLIAHDKILEAVGYNGLKNFVVTAQNEILWSLAT